MTKKIETNRKDLEEQNQFLKSMLKSIDDIKKGRISKFEFSE